MGLGALMGLGGGGAPAPEGGGGEPEALLQQIMDLMDQYLAMGPETPAFDVISDALPAIEEAMGGGGMPAPMEEGPAAEGEAPVEEEEGQMAPKTPPQGFEQASAMALDDLKKRKGKGY